MPLEGNGFIVTLFQPTQQAGKVSPRFIRGQRYGRGLHGVYCRNKEMDCIRSSLSSEPREARQARFRALAPVSGEYRMKVLNNVNKAVVSEKTSRKTAESDLHIKLGP
jgi:hypothetical protein